MKRYQRYLGSLAAVLFLGASFLGLGSAVRAQQAPRSSRQQPMEIPAQYPTIQDDPEQQGLDDAGAARLSFIQGDISTQHSDSSEWLAGTLNTPIVNGDRVSTGRGSRAEIQLDHANVLRMSGESSVNVVNLSRTQMQLQVGQGLVNFDTLQGSDADIEIETPNVAIHPQMGEGSFRILVNSDGETIIDVRKGSAEISTPQGSTRVERNQRITIQGDADNAQYQVSGAPGNDDWDKWNNDRDRVITSAASWQHTNPYYTGSQDLDAYGQWNDVPDYGSVWFPASADAGWAPYRDGRWVYEPYYGWTWVSYEPWGWAPYHYGRWFVYGGRWGWWPGPVYGGYRPIWAPAYVSFLGFGGAGWGVDIGVGFGSVGWLPCGPGDRFYPWYGRGVRQVNVVNVYNINNNRGGFAPLRGGSRGYSNMDRAFNDDRVRGGISSMRADQFGRGRVPQQQQRFDAGSFRQASMMTGRNPVSPSRESFRPSDRNVNPSAVPNRAGANQRFFSTNARQGGQGQAGRGQAGFNRGVNSGNPSQQNTQRPGFRGFGTRDSGNQIPASGQDQGRNQGNRQGGPNSGPNREQQNRERPGFRNFGSRDSGNATLAPTQDRNSNPGNRQGGPNPGANQPQQNSERPGFRRFGSRNSGNDGSAPSQTAPPSQDNNGGQRNFGTPAQRQENSAPNGREGNWRNFNPPSNQSQPDNGGRSFGRQRDGQSQYNPPQQSESPRQYQGNARGNSGNYGYSRPPLNMEQPVVTPRPERSNPPPSVRSAPSGGGDGGGYSRGGPSRGEYRDGPSGGGSRGGNSEGRQRGGSSPSEDRRSSSGRNRR